MSKLTKIVKIDDTEFELTQLGGAEGLDVFDALTERLGPAIANAIGSAVALTDKAAREAAIGIVVMRGLAALPADFKLQLRVRFAALSKVKTGAMMLPLVGEGQNLPADGVFDQHFAGRFGHMTRWLVACLQWSFGDFLPSSPGSAEPAAPTT